MSDKFRASISVKIVTAALVVALADGMFWQRGLYNAAFGVFALGALLALLAARPAVRQGRASLIAAGLAMIYAVSLIWNPKLLAAALFIVAAASAAILPRMAGFGDGWRWFQRGMWAGIMAPVRPLLDLQRYTRVRSRRHHARTGPWAALRMIALPVVGGLIFTALFAQANPIIEQWVQMMVTWEIDPEWPVRLMLWLVIALFMGLLLRPTTLARVLPLPEFTGKQNPLLSPASVRLSLIVFNALFAVQNAMDIAYLWGWAKLPQGMTLAQYAHRGAYPLIVTALLAGLFVLVALSPRSDLSRDGEVRRLVVAWVGQNVLLVASSVLRTLDYVEAYSLTVFRISALLWMGLVACGLMLVCWRMLTGKSAAWLVNANLLAAGMVLTGVCLVDLGAVAAQWNVTHAREIDGDGAGLDVCYLAELEDSALPAILSLESRPLARDLAARLRVVRQKSINNLENAIDGKGWFALGDLRLADARMAVQSSGLDKTDLPVLDCRGNPARVEVAPAPAPLTQGAGQ